MNSLLRLRNVSRLQDWGSFCGYRPVSFRVLEPPLPDTRKLRFEPARDYIHRDAAIGVIVDTSDLFGCHGRVPGTGQQRSNDIEFLGVVQECL